jgi:hypothetical protein
MTKKLEMFLEEKIKCMSKHFSFILEFCITLGMFAYIHNIKNTKDKISRA